MKREEHLKFCKRCKKQEFNSKKGIVCSLTGEIADFENECPDFEEQKFIKKKRKINNDFIELLKQRGDLKISSSFTFFGVALWGIVSLALFPMLLFIITAQEFHPGMFFGLIFYLIFLFFFIYQFIYASNARISADQITLKKTL